MAGQGSPFLFACCGRRRETFAFPEMYEKTLLFFLREQWGRKGEKATFPYIFMPPQTVARPSLCLDKGGRRGIFGVYTAKLHQ